MATTLNSVKIALRIDDLSNWNNSTLILNDGEIALIRMPSNEIKMKCGDGTSLISSLSYVNETEFYSHIVKANNINIGLHQTNTVDPSTYSAVHGMKLSAYGQFSEVHGVHAKSNSQDSYAYVWNGNIGSYYQSNGEGSFSLNPKNGLSGIYVGHRTLADILADKIYIDGNRSSTLSICHISQKDYHDIVMSDKGPDSNMLYVVSSDGLDMYGEQIKNVADATDLSDAVNLNQLCSAISSINIPEIPKNISEFTNDVIYTKLSVDGRSSDQFNVKHVSDAEYYDEVQNGIDENTLYVVSSENINAYGEKITNVADGVDLSDAVNVNQLCNAISSIYVPSKVSEFENDAKYTSISVDNEAINEFNVKHVSQDEYYSIVQSEDGIDRNTLYVVSSDSLNMFNERIENVAEPSVSSDAATKHYVDSTALSIQDRIDSIEIPSKTSELENDSNYIAAKIDEHFVSTLNIQHISQDDYYSLVQSDEGPLSNTLYIVSSDSLNMHNESIENVAYPNFDTDAANAQYVKDQIGDLSITYLNRTISLHHADKTLASFDASDFIVDGMLLSAYLNSDNLILEFNTESKKTAVSVDLHKYIDVYTAGNGLCAENGKFRIDDTIVATSADVEMLNNKIDRKVNVNGNSVSEFNVVNVDSAEYYSLVTSETGPLSNTLYIVSSNEMNMYGERITNVADPVDLSDATNVAYVISSLNQLSNLYISNNLVANSQIKLNGKSFIIDGDSAKWTFSDGYLKFEGNNNGIDFQDGGYNNFIGGGGIAVEHMSCIQFGGAYSFDSPNKTFNDIISGLSFIDTQLSTKINEKPDVFVDDKKSNINIKHISQENYQELVVDNQVETSVLYIVSSDSLNMYGEKIENLADATISSDAVNLKQLTNNITDFQVIRPYFINNALKLRVKLFSNQEMTDLVGEIDSSDIYMVALFNNNEQQSWIDFTPNGLEANFSNCPVLVKLSNWLSDNNLKYQFERLFISYEWYYIKDSVEHISDKYSIVVPSYTEVGANSSDTVSKTEYDSLVANIRKDIYSPALNDDGMYVCYDNKTNIFDHSLSGVIQIILDSFELYKQYDIKFTAGNDLKFEFCKHDYLNGVEFDDSWNINKEYEFIEGITYLIKIKHDLIQIVESTYPTKNLSYKLVTVNPESDGTTYNIKNRTISTIRISDGNTPITINMPNAINGGFARDFILRIEIASSNAPFCTFTGMDSSWLAESEDDEWYILKPGTNVISFTEMT